MHPKALGTLARYYRPAPPGVETNVLFVGNVGPAVGVLADTLRAACSQWAPVAVDVPDEAKSFAFVSFSSAEAARAARQALHQSSIAGRQVSAQFARLSPKYQVRCHICHALVRTAACSQRCRHRDGPCIAAIGTLSSMQSANTLICALLSYLQHASVACDHMCPQHA